MLRRMILMVRRPKVRTTKHAVSNSVEQRAYSQMLVCHIQRCHIQRVLGLWKYISPLKLPHKCS